MAKRLLIATSVIVAVLLVMFGSELVGLYRLTNFVLASDAAYRAAGGPWPHLTDECTVCHGDKGRSLNQGYPSLAGQPAPYLATQLHNFAHGARANPNMAPLAMTFSEKDIKQLAAYFAKQQASDRTFFAPDPKLRERGSRLVASTGCAACHGDDLMGHDQFPRLSGQGYDYLVEQLDAFATGTRVESSGTMKQLASAASPADRRAMAAYLASLAPQSNDPNLNYADKELERVNR